MRMRQSLAEIEEAFHEEAVRDQVRAEQIRRDAVARTRERQVKKVHKRGSLRFVLLVLAMIATAVLVTVAMFETLYIVLG
jgi:anti-sigma-K factor RskA